MLSRSKSFMHRYLWRAFFAATFLLPASAFLTNNGSNGIHRCNAHRHHGSMLRALEFEGEVEVSRTYKTIKDGKNDETETVTSSHPIKYHIHNKMNLSSQKAAPILVLHGGPGVPSDYLLPLKDVVPYRSIVFYDQLGCGRSPGPDTSAAYSIEDSLDDLEAVIKKIGLRRFHLYGQSFGGILAFEYIKRLSEREDNDNDPKCLSAILSSSPCDVQVVETAAETLIEALLEEDPNRTTIMERFKAQHICQTEPQPALKNAYEKAGKPGIWRGTDSIKNWKATPPSESAKRMPSCMVMRGSNDFVTDECVQGWKDAFNHPYVRLKELEGLAHHGLLEDGARYGELVDSFFAEYD